MGKKGMENMINSILTNKPATIPLPERSAEQPPKNKGGRPRIRPEPAAAGEVGCKPGEARTTIILSKELMERIRRLAHWDRRAMKTVVAMALEDYVEAYEKKHGKLKPVPNE